MDSSCELLSSLDAASGSVHCCEVPCRALEASASTMRVTVRDVLLGLASVRGLTEKTREAHRWVWVYGGSPCTAVTLTCTVLKDGFETRHNWAALSPSPSEQLTLRTAGSLQGVPPSCCGRRVAVWSGVCSSRPSGFGEAATTRKQPANLAVKGAEESLSILPDYAATVRPSPKRC